MDDKVKEYFTDEQLATPYQRREQLGEGRIAAVESGSPDLYVTWRGGRRSRRTGRDRRFVRGPGP